CCQRRIVDIIADIGFIESGVHRTVGTQRGERDRIATGEIEGCSQGGEIRRRLQLLLRIDDSNEIDDETCKAHDHNPKNAHHDRIVALLAPSKPLHEKFAPKKPSPHCAASADSSRDSDSTAIGAMPLEAVGERANSELTAAFAFEGSTWRDPSGGGSSASG